MNGDRLARLTSRGGSNGREKGPAPQDAPQPARKENSPPEDEVVDLEQTLPGDPALFLQEPDEIAPADLPPEQALEEVRLENAELRQTLAELQRILEDARLREENWTRQEKEYEGLLEEKSEVIRDLHRKLKELPEGPERAAAPAAGPLPREEELLALHEELERERRQLQEDEETLMRQMRDMELQMSRERAELARQRTDLQRLHTEIQHELELAARDATLRERLAPLQRRAQDVVHRRGAAPPKDHTQAPAPPAASVPAAGAPKESSGLFRRLFGK
jgi:DNA repair exonuclease SbcCD ATPase subunit